MSGFSSTWLALREPLDLAARNSDVETTFLKLMPGEFVSVLDLASGAGSTVAALSEKFQGEVTWLLTDFDPDLLEIASRRFEKKSNCALDAKQIDLAANLEQLALSDFSAVTTSAFLDLVSEDFLQRLVAHVVRSRKPFLACLTYDGRATFQPEHPLDEELREGLNRHQQGNKGFGPALGPDAAQRAVSMFREAGYEVVSGASDWTIETDQKSFLQEFLSGWRRVGREIGINETKLEAWWQNRCERISASDLSMRVGHLDFVAYPTEMAGA